MTGDAQSIMGTQKGRGKQVQGELLGRGSAGPDASGASEGGSGRKTPGQGKSQKQNVGS